MFTLNPDGFLSIDCRSIFFLELDGFRRGGEEREGCSRTLEVIHLGIAVVLVILLPKAGIGIQHGFVKGADFR